jgi:hypothetical protein
VAHHDEALCGQQPGAVEVNTATPWLGVMAGANAYAAMLWVAGLAGAVATPGQDVRDNQVGG